MFQPNDRDFDACLPQLEKAVRIASLHDAQVFARRWVIRDKDPALKALVRRLDKAHGAEAAASAVSDMKSALAARGLLRRMGEA